MRFFADLTAATIEASRVRPGEQVEGGYRQVRSATRLSGPEARACYPAVWTQDFALATTTGFITPEEMWNHLRLVAEAQNGSKELKLKSGAIIPPFAVPDHVLFNGKAVFYPGTYLERAGSGRRALGHRSAEQ